MAIALRVKNEKYEDTPLSNFPVSEDTWNRMSDISFSLFPQIKQYNKLFSDGNITEANQLLVNNPELLDCFFNADKYNQLRDGLIALERYYLENVETFINNVAQNTIGLNDNPTSDQELYTAYSVKKVKDLINELKNTSTATLSASAWSSTAPYTQTVSVSGITANDTPILSIRIAPDATAERAKSQKKAFSYIDRAETGNGTITFYCLSKKPTVSFYVWVKGK